ncbi:MAG: flagellar biosynthetic protein FliO [Vallitaleaceae bacterium]|nr:flagellar biosynthetic protein FliO [Vallitaleaceae bacterium]
MNYFLMGVVGESSGVSNNSAGQIIYILLLFVVIFFGAYYTSKLLGKYSVKRLKNANLRVVEAITVGPQKSLQLVKVGSEYVLIGVTKDRITFMKEVSEDHVDLNLLQSSSIDVVPFSQYFDKLLKNKKVENKDQK